MKAALFPDRGVVKVAGDDVRKFLNGLITSDIAKMTPARAGFAALLTPQGKIIVDFLLAEAPPADRGGFFLDCPRALAYIKQDFRDIRTRRRHGQPRRHDAIDHY